jgi:alpha-mannosidase
MWVEPDLNLPGGESLVRQLLVGQREFQKLYGVTARIGWNPDSFGYNWQLPQIYKRSGMDYFVTQKMHWNDTNVLPFRLFWWQSPDGSKVLTYFPTDYVHDNVNPTRISADFAESAQRNPGTTEMLDLYGIGDHGGGPTRDMLDQADHWIAADKQPDTAIPTMHYGTAQRYFTDVESHLNPVSPVWNYDLIAKGYNPPPLATGKLATGKLEADSPNPDQLMSLPTWNDELYFEYHRGVYTTQANHKRNMRVAETQTLDAEKLASLAWLDGAAYPTDILTENWKKITFNQFHDLAAGSGIAVIYRDAQQDFTEVANADKQIDESSFKAIESNIDNVLLPFNLRNDEDSNLIRKNSAPIVVFNALPWMRSEVISLAVQTPTTETDPSGVEIRDDDNKLIPTQLIEGDPNTHLFKALVQVRDVPGMGYTVLHANDEHSGGAPIGAERNKKSAPVNLNLTNSKLSVVIEKQNGCITSLTTAEEHFNPAEYLTPNACANQLQTYADNPKQYDAWNIDPGTLDGKMTPIDTLDSIKVIADGPLRKTIEIKRTWQHSHFTQDISLDAGADFVRVDTTVDWHETHTLLKAAFPLAHSGPKATFEIPYGAIERPTTRDNSWEKAKFEVPAQRWADLGDATAGVSILNDSKYGYDALGNTLRLTLLRSPTWPDPDADRGLQHFTYEIYPHTGTWQTAETVHRGYELNTPLTAQQVFPHTGTLPPTHSFASVDEPNVILSAVKKAEDANALIFRFYEATGKGTDAHLHIPPGALYAIETNLMETPLPNTPHLPLASDTITLPIKPWEIRTLEVVYPQAVK